MVPQGSVGPAFEPWLPWGEWVVRWSPSRRSCRNMPVAAYCRQCWRRKPRIQRKKRTAATLNTQQPDRHHQGCVVACCDWPVGRRSLRRVAASYPDAKYGTFGPASLQHSRSRDRCRGLPSSNGSPRWPRSSACSAAAIKRRNCPSPAIVYRRELSPSPDTDDRPRRPRVALLQRRDMQVSARHVSLHL
jgi:hypothetical protein